MKTITVSDESADELFRDILSADYLSLIDDIKTMEAKIEDGEELLPYQREDLINWLKTVNAINVLLDWYLPAEEAEKIRSKV